MKIQHITFTLGLGLLITACESGTGGNGINSISALPNMSTIVGASSSSSSLSYSALADAPIFLEIDANRDFFDGQLSFLTNSDEDKRLFESGMGACRMVDSVMRSMTEILKQSTVCYIKGMSSLPNVSVTPTVASSQIFAQDLNDKLVRVDVSNMSNHGDGTESMNVFIKVLGINSVSGSGNRYALQIYFCESGTPTGYESISVDRDSGVMTSTASDLGNWGSNSRSVTAHLKASGSSFVFDTSKERTATVNWVGSGDQAGSKFKSSIQIDGSNRMTAKLFYSGSYLDVTNTPQTFTDKSYSYSEISGSSAADLKFLQGAFSGISEQHWGNYTYGGATQYTTYYQAIQSGDFYTAIQNYVLASDSFFDSTASVDIDLSSYDCGATPNYVLNMDFSTPEIAALEAECEGERFEGQYLCDSQEIRFAQDSVYAP